MARRSGSSANIPVVLAWLAAAWLALAVHPLPAAAQIPETFTNLRHLPEDIERDVLIEIMRRFSLSLGVRCQYCHVGGDGIAFEGVDFASDDDPDKIKARWMLAMVDDLNGRLDAELPGRDTPPVKVTCKTCHRGIARPVLLAQELRMALDDGGADSLSVTYERARRMLEFGVYDFDEWEVNLLAEELEHEGRPADALAVWELNRQHHPRSVSILSALGRLYEAADRTEDAIEAYTRILEIAPDHARARARLTVLRGG